MNISKIINAERKRRKLSVEAIARQSGIATQTAYRFFQGKPIQSDTLEKILNFLGAEIKFKK
jgi:transcriptional regulator with XRE-family HTH domain